MQIGFLGLGKMGKGLVQRLINNSHTVIAWNRSPEPLAEIAQLGAKTAQTVSELVQQLEAPRIIWLMVPAGQPIDDLLAQLVPQLQAGDIIIDGGNSHYLDTTRRAAELAKKDIIFMDVGVSGGPDGARNGACLMIGGNTEIVAKLQPIFSALAAPNAIGHFGRTGAGHFAKMVHNGIEYGMMQAIAEGAAILKGSEFDLDLAEVFRVYNQRSVIESRLVGWTENALRENQNLDDVSAKISHTGEGEWTVKAAKSEGVSAPIIAGAFQIRVESDQIDPQSLDGFRNKIVSALRGQFGHHATK